MTAPALLVAALAASPMNEAPPPKTTLRFEVSMAEGLVSGPQDGRLFVILDVKGRPEPRSGVGQTGLDAPPMFARDVKQFAPGRVEMIDEQAIGFPVESLAHLPTGDYSAQAVFDTNNDLKSLSAPGNLSSVATKVHLDPAQGGTIKLELTRKEPPEQLPPDTERVAYLKIPSKLLSDFHGRPMFLRASVVLPRDFERDPERRYPLRVHIGGYGTRFTSYRREWLNQDDVKMLILVLDGDGPYGDCYQVNSANNGPYGDAITKELIPHVEHRFRGTGARVLDGGSTGGWVSLALQVFYPDFFQGAWASCPDGVDFRSFQLVNIYQDENAYANRHGFERPAARDVNGDVRYTMRHECQMENVLGAGDSWTMSGQQWGAWNATYGPRGDDGRPVPLWDPKTGRIDHRAAEHWKNYDLRLILERDWATLGPKVRGKIHIWVGEADDFFLNNAVNRLDSFLSKAEPPFGGTIAYGPGRGHGWIGIDERAMMKQMAAAVAAGQGAGGGR